jgi:hypothetical protein
MNFIKKLISFLTPGKRTFDGVKEPVRAEEKPVRKTNGGPNFTPKSPSPATLIQRRQRKARRVMRHAA